MLTSMALKADKQGQDADQRCQIRDIHYFFLDVQKCLGPRFVSRS